MDYQTWFKTTDGSGLYEQEIEALVEAEITSGANPASFTKVGVNDGGLSTPSFYFNNDSDTGLYLAGTGVLGVTVGSTGAYTVSPTGIHSNVRLFAPTGSSASPAFAFKDYPSSGMYATSNIVRLACNGEDAFQTSNVASLSYTPFVCAANGVAGLPAYTFNNSSTSGMYLAYTGVVGFSAQNAQRMLVSATGVFVGTKSASGDQRLHVQSAGSAYVWLEGDADNASENDDAVIWMTTDRNNSRASIGIDNTDNQLYIRTGNAGPSVPSTNLNNIVFQTRGQGTGATGPRMPDFSVTPPRTVCIMNSDSQTTFGGQVLGVTGTTGAPSYSFASHPDTGIYLESTGTIGFSCDAARKMVLAPSSVTITPNITASGTLDVVGSIRSTGSIQTGTIANGVNTDITFTGLTAGRSYLVSFQVNFNQPGIALGLYGADTAGGIGRMTAIVQNTMTLALQAGTGTTATFRITHAIGGTYGYVANIMYLM